MCDVICHEIESIASVITFVLLLDVIIQQAGKTDDNIRLRVMFAELSFN